MEAWENGTKPYSVNLDKKKIRISWRLAASEIEDNLLFFIKKHATGRRVAGVPRRVLVLCPGSNFQNGYGSMFADVAAPHSNPNVKAQMSN